MNGVIRGALQRVFRKKFGFCPNRTPLLRQKPIFFRALPRTRPLSSILQKATFSLVKSRLAPGSVGSLFACLFVRRHDKNGQIRRWMLIMDVECPPVITSLGETLDQTRPGKGILGPPSLLQTWHWVLFHHCLAYQVQVFRWLAMDLRMKIEIWNLNANILFCQ